MPAIVAKEIVAGLQKTVSDVKQNVLGQFQTFKSANEDLEK